MQHMLFEVSWEVCNKVGGIHTVLSTKAKTMVGRFGDDYICLGPWLLNAESELPFEESPGFEDFAESCREMGVPVRVGRWLIPGRPRTLLIEFSKLYPLKDGILAGLWERHAVNSITGGWDYVEPVLFGHACGMVIEKWLREMSSQRPLPPIAHFHEWMTCSGMLYLKDHAPEVGSVFTTHATMLGRAVSATGLPPEEGLLGRDPEYVAESMGVTAKHSLEGVAARSADVFTTVSNVTADEASVFHRRMAAPILPNGIDLEVIDEIAGPLGRDEARLRLEQLASRFVGEDVSGAAMISISGRYEFHNKGIDLFLDALQRMERLPGRRVVAFVMVPAGNSGVKKALVERLAGAIPAEGALGISTHNLFDEAHDPVHRRAGELGLTNPRGSRVKLIQIPIYLSPRDDLLQQPYEALLRAMDLSCFPSFYEPWGYTPEESLAVGVPTVTTDRAGFGVWCLENGVGSEQGVQVLRRVGVGFDAAGAALLEMLEAQLASTRPAHELAAVCRSTAQRTAWSALSACYLEAYEQAVAAARRRAQAQTPARPRRRVPLPKSAGPSHGPRLVHFDVVARIPRELEGLDRLAANYWWSWDPEAQSLFDELSPLRWEACGHNPVRFLREVYPEDLAARASDRGYCERLSRVLARFDAYLHPPRSERESGAVSARHPVAYFSAEFAVHESLRVYSGGLGVLAGDHLKSASDLGLPLLGVGLFYRGGYMRQRLTAAGDQLAEQDPNDPALLPLELVCDAAGAPVRVELTLPSSTLVLQAYRVHVGRVRLYLLDADVPENRPEDRAITRELYGGDHENRLRQEIVLGRGGARLLAALGIEPSVWHCNEGHAAFLSLERVRGLIREHGLTFDEARELCRATTVFTTHTPVPAGHDRFGADLMRRYFSDVPSWLGVPWERFFDLGRADASDGSFNMTYLAISFAAVVNGVSQLHGEVSRKLLHPYWRGLLPGEVPVAHVTNGVHLPTWTGPEIAGLLRRGGEPLAPADFSAAGALSDAALWDARSAAKRRLLRELRERIEGGFRRRSDRPMLCEKILAGLDEQALWIGFARRFAPYKRAQLLFRDRERLARLLTDPRRPLRIVLSGKAHPRDALGQQVLREVVALTREEPFAGRIFFVEDYDTGIAARLVQGVDVWLNTPTRPLEASGTSGMKSAANGGLNVSILDGWWCEAADGRNGWSIGGGQVYDDPGLQDELDATTLYGLLEDEVLPCFFEDREQGRPRAWLARVRHALASIPPFFNTDRMVCNYLKLAYEPLASCGRELGAEGHRAARALAERNARIRKGFRDLRIAEAHIGDMRDLAVGDAVEVQLRLELGELRDEDVVCELVVGHAQPSGELARQTVVPLKRSAEDGARAGHAYEGSWQIERCGSFRYGIRVRARRSGLQDHGLEDLVLWA